MHQHMREPIILTPVNHHGCRQEIAHRLSSAGDRCVHGRRAISRLFRDEVDDLVRGGIAVSPRAQVSKRSSAAITQHVHPAHRKAATAGGGVVRDQSRPLSSASSNRSPMSVLPVSVVST